MTRKQGNKTLIDLFRAKGLTSFLAVVLVLVVSALPGEGQTRSNIIETNDYVLTLPATKWRSETEPGTIRDRIYFMYEDEDPIELYVRKKLVDTDVGAAELIQKRERWDRATIRGYVKTGSEIFEGEFDGAKYAYEYVSDGKVTGKQIYYLQTDNRTIYLLEFSGSQTKLWELKDQIETIARSFRPQ